MVEREVVVVLGALELGIIPPHENISKCLTSLNVKDNRKARRKYRKVSRKLGEFRTLQHQRAAVERECFQVGLSLLAGRDQK